MSGLLSVWILATVAGLVFMTVAFGWAFLQKRVDVVDIAWGPAFLVVAAVAYISNPQTLAHRVILILVGIWAARLYWHILQRFQSHREQDPRYTTLINKWPAQARWAQVYGKIFVLQALLVTIISAPVFVGMHEQLYHPAALLIGTLAWLVGFACESLADRQLAHFIKKPANKGKLLQTGLWAYSRHPNYLGELTQWWGIWVITIGYRLTFLGLVGPLVLTGLICYVSGVPLAEKRAARKPGWEAYKAKTGRLLPRIRGGMS